MKIVKRPGALLFILLLSACSAISVSRDYQPDMDWAAYSTYAFYPGMETGLSELDTRRLLDAVEAVLREKGYGQSEEPDFMVNIFSESYQDAPDSQVGVGIGGTGNNMGGGISVGIPVSTSNLKRRITFDLIDAGKDQLIWQAISRDSYREGDSPEQRDARMEAVARKVFSEFPPER